MADQLDIDGKLRNGKDRPPVPAPFLLGLGNTNPIATRGPTLGLGSPLGTYAEAERGASVGIVRGGSIGEALALQFKKESEGYVGTSERPLVLEAKGTARKPTLKPAGQVVLFEKVMEDWGFGDQEASTLLGFEAASDIREIYRGAKPVGQRDANDRLRAVLRIATDLKALFRTEDAIRDWLSEPQRDLGRVTPRALLTEGSMENLLRVKYYAAYLSGR
jgi:hypothetical protein